MKLLPLRVLQRGPNIDAEFLASATLFNMHYNSLEQSLMLWACNSSARYFAKHRSLAIVGSGLSSLDRDSRIELAGLLRLPRCTFQTPPRALSRGKAPHDLS